MPRPRKIADEIPADPSEAIADYRYTNAKKKNIPPAGIAAQGKVREVPKHRFEYNPHLPPVLRFDQTGSSDKPSELLEIAKQRALSASEAQILSDALRNREPWLEWAGKREAKSFEVDPVALHIHERVSAQAILRVAARQDVTRSLFADPEQDYREAVQFYKHDIDWTNRLILGDSLAVMTSLAKREDLAAKVQCIFLDPPYGIKFRSNFQSEVGKQKVGDKTEDLTREAETVKAYRDTWELGTHSYLSYVRDRLHCARELLTDSGSIFVQISDENIHRMRAILDEVFGPANYVNTITFVKTSGLASKYLKCACDYILWYARDKSVMKFERLYATKVAGEEGASKYESVEERSGLRRPLTAEERRDGILPPGARLYTTDNTASQGNQPVPYTFRNETYVSGWKTTAPTGLDRLNKSNRLSPMKSVLRYIRYLSDFESYELNNVWIDIGGIQSRTDAKVYVVQTATEAIKRCILMTTKPGDLVVDPTCGSGTTAYVAEHWGRRWITIDTSRVAIAIARQRLLTAKFEYFKVKDATRGVSGGFVCKAAPHIMLSTISQNTALDAIFAHWEPILIEKLAALNGALGEVTADKRAQLSEKLRQKLKRKDKSTPITDGDVRRLSIPAADFGWNEWDAPFDADPDWPQALQSALIDYRKSWRAKMDEIDKCVAASAAQEELVDQPEIVKNTVRVSGPFTVEGTKPAEESLNLESPIGGVPADELESFDECFSTRDIEVESLALYSGEARTTEAYVDKMIRLLSGDGVRFPDNKTVRIFGLEPIQGSILQAEGSWEIGGLERKVSVVFGPQYGPVTAEMVEECIPRAGRLGYDDLLVAGFSFDAAATAIITDDVHPRLRLHYAHIRPDVNMDGLLKNTPSSQLFTVSGLPRASAIKQPDNEYIVQMDGVDIYDPISNSIIPTGASKVAAWFLDSDYDGAAFCITQAFFPDKSAWDKLSKALTNVVDADRFAAFSGTTSLPFPIGKHKRVAVKVIDPRGNEVMRVIRLDGKYY